MCWTTRIMVYMRQFTKDSGHCPFVCMNVCVSVRPCNKIFHGAPIKILYVILISPDLACRFRGGVLKGVGLGRLGVEPEVPRPHHHNLGGTLLPRHLALGSLAIVSSCFVASKTFCKATSPCCVATKHEVEVAELPRLDFKYGSFTPLSLPVK